MGMVWVKETMKIFMKTFQYEKKTQDMWTKFPSATFDTFDTSPPP